VGIPAVDRRERHRDARRVPARHAARAALACAGLIALALPAAAAAQVPPPPPPPAPPPAQGSLALQAEKVHRDGPRRVALTRDAWRVRGVVRPYVPGQTVVVRFYRDGRRIHQQSETVLPGPGGRRGFFLTPFTSRREGRIVVRASHAGTPELETLRSKALRVGVLHPRIGSSGVLVRLLQRGLDRMRYAVSRSGTYDSATARAVMAWRKVNGQPRTFAASESVVRAVLDGRGAFKVRHPGDGRHVEADISRQVMALIKGRRVHRVYHVSSGAPATPTVLGRFKVYRKDPGTNSLGMVHSTYFIGGYAIHGYASVPPFNASHGCLRVPIPNAWSIYEWVRMGDVVRVYP
jgi:L,D-transpeptidase catalytic domain